MSHNVIRQDELLVQACSRPQPITTLSRPCRPSPMRPKLQAASRGEVEKVRAMLDNKAIVSARNNKLLTALHWAVTMGHVAVADLLIERGADVEAKATDGHTPLHMAAREGDAEMVQRLLEAHANPNSVNNAGQTPADLALAFAEEEPQVAQALLAAGARRQASLLTSRPKPAPTPQPAHASDGPASSDGGPSSSVGCGTDDLESLMAGLSTHAVLAAPAASKPQAQEPEAKPASVACGTDDLESLMAGLVGQLASESSGHSATLSG